MYDFVDFELELTKFCIHDFVSYVSQYDDYKPSSHNTISQKFMMEPLQRIPKKCPNT